MKILIMMIYCKKNYKIKLKTNILFLDKKIKLKTLLINFLKHKINKQKHSILINFKFNKLVT
jgi:hypothetical protein